MKVKESVSLSVLSNSWRPHGLTVTCQAPLSMEFSRQEYWSEWPFPFPGDLPDAGIEPGSPALQADSLPSELLGKPCFKIHMVISPEQYNICNQDMHIYVE